MNGTRKRAGCQLVCWALAGELAQRGDASSCSPTNGGGVTLCKGQWHLKQRGKGAGNPGGRWLEAPHLNQHAARQSERWKGGVLAALWIKARTGLRPGPWKSRPCLETRLSSAHDFRSWESAKAVGGGEKPLVAERSEPKQWLSLCSWALHLVPAHGLRAAVLPHTAMTTHGRGL